MGDTTYETREVLDDSGLAHLMDDESAGFPLCGRNYRPAGDDVERRGLCQHCREAAGRERRRRGGDLRCAVCGRVHSNAVPCEQIR